MVGSKNLVLQAARPVLLDSGQQVHRPAASRAHLVHREISVQMLVSSAKKDAISLQTEQQNVSIAIQFCLAHQVFEVPQVAPNVSVARRRLCSLAYAFLASRV